MNIEMNHFDQTGSRVIRLRDGGFLVADSDGKAIRIKGPVPQPDSSLPITDRTIRKALERKNSLKTKETFALIALSPIILELAVFNNESVDRLPFEQELWSRVKENNPFYQIDSNESFKNSTNYLLQIKGNSLEKIADSILTDSKVNNFVDRRAGFDMARQELIELIKSKNPERFSNK